MNRSKVDLFLFVLIGNYFFTLLIIGLIAAWISLLRKPKPLENKHSCRSIFVFLHAFPHWHKQSDQLRFPCFLR